MSQQSRGSISGLIVSLFMGGIALAGLSFDGGASIATYMRISDVAQNAARLGAQQVIGIRDGNPHIDSQSASDLIGRYTNSFQIRSTREIHGTAVTVHVETKQQMKILGLFGVGTRTIRASRTADLVSG